MIPRKDEWFETDNSSEVFNNHWMSWDNIVTSTFVLSWFSLKWTNVLAGFDFLYQAL